MRTRWWTAAGLAVLLSLTASTAGAHNHTPPPDPDTHAVLHGNVAERLSKTKSFPVIVITDGTATLEGDTVNWTDDSMTTATVEVHDEGQVQKLLHTPGVLDVNAEQMLLQANASISHGGDQAHGGTGADTTDGDGQIIVILDSGFDLGESRITTGSKVVAEYCSVTDNSCPGGTNTSFASGSSSDSWCQAPDPTTNGCFHGTLMAEAAAGWSGTAGDDENGVAPGAKLILIRVGQWDSAGTGVTYDQGAIITAMSWVKTKMMSNTWAASGKVVAANMSFGTHGWSYPGVCQDTTRDLPMMNAINGLKQYGDITTVVAAGNDGVVDGLQWPACIQQSYSVVGLNGNNIDAASDMGTYADTAAPYTQFFAYHGLGYNAGGTSGSAAAISGALAVVADQDVQTYPKREAAIAYSGFETTDNRSGCSPNCWGVMGVDMDAALQRNLEIGTFNNTGVQRISPIRIFDSRNGFGKSIWDSQTAPTVKILSAIGDVFYVSPNIGIAAGDMKGIILQTTFYSSTTTTDVDVNYSGGSSGSTAFSTQHLEAGMTTPVVATSLARMDGGTVAIDPIAGSAGVHAAVDIIALVGKNSDVDFVSPYGKMAYNATIGPGATVSAQVGGLFGIPTGVTGVFGTLDVKADASNATYAGMTASGNHDVDVAANKQASNLVFAEVTADNVSIYNNAGTATVKFNVQGWFTSGDTDMNVIPRHNNWDTAAIGSGGTNTFSAAIPCSGFGNAFFTLRQTGVGWIEVNWDNTPHDHDYGTAYANIGDTAREVNSVGAGPVAVELYNNGVSSSTVDEDILACYG